MSNTTAFVIGCEVGVVLVFVVVVVTAWLGSLHDKRRQKDGGQ